MTPLLILKQAVSEFQKQSCRYCLIGGHAASLYRVKERLTRDVDFAVVGIPIEASRAAAEAVIAGLGLQPTLGFMPGSRCLKSKGAVSLITSHPAPGEFTGIIDILLPRLPWIENAVARAQLNLIELGFGKGGIIR